ncbi:MAG: protein-tyrosine-phosphatase [Bacteroidota bacterium]
MTFYQKIADLVAQLQAEADHITPTRKAQLAKLAAYVASDPAAQLNFICTHNSRRSHLGQIWAAVAAAHYDLEDVRTFSGGTEATAFNPRAVAALERAGFRVDNPGGDNPRYAVHFAADQPPLVCFSKVYDDPVNPQQNFAAVMTCDHADANCPFIPGANLRLPLTYVDPKEADDTPAETARYDERLRQIGREIIYAFSLVGNPVT